MTKSSGTHCEHSVLQTRPHSTEEVLLQQAQAEARITP